MKTSLFARALALASLFAPTLAAAQVADRAAAPSGMAPIQSPCVVQADGTCAAVKDSVPLPTQTPDTTPIASSTLTANGTFFLVDTTGYRGISLFFAGPGGQGILNIDGSNDNASWQTLPFMNTGTTAYTSATQTTAVSYYIPASVRFIRARLSGYTSGTYSVTAFLRQLNIDPGQVSGSINATNVTGNNAAGTTDTGNPLKIGGVGSDGAPTAVATGQRVNGWFSRYGAQVGRLSDVNGQGIDADQASSDFAGVLNYRLRADSTLRVFDGTQLARVRDANTVAGTSGTGLLGTGSLGYDGALWRGVRVDGNGVTIVKGSDGQGSTIGGSFVGVGGYGSASAPSAVADGQGVRLWLGRNGQAIVGGQGTSGSDGQTQLSSITEPGGGSRPLWTVGGVFNGTGYDRQRDATSANATTGTGLLGAGILGQYTPTLPTYTAGQFGTLSMNARGLLQTTIVDAVGNPMFFSTSGGADGLAASAIGNVVGRSNGYLYNGSTWDRARGDTTGAYTVEKGGPSIATSQTSVGTTAALVAPARVGRNKVTVSIGAANSCVLGNAGVTLSTGFPLQPVAGASITLDTAAAIYAVCNATTTVSDVETF